MAVDDPRKIKTLVANLTVNYRKAMYSGRMNLSLFSDDDDNCSQLCFPGTRGAPCSYPASGWDHCRQRIASDKLESIFREFEQVEASEPNAASSLFQYHNAWTG